MDDGFITLDSGKRVEFENGAVRDTDEDKSRYDLIDPIMLTRLADLMTRGAKKYGEDNWKNGIHVKRYYGSALRHLMQWAMGDKKEDHLAAIIFNVMGIICTIEWCKEGKLPLKYWNMNNPIIDAIHETDDDPDV